MGFQFVRGKYQSDGSILAYVRDDKGRKDGLKILGFKPYFHVEAGELIPDTYALDKIESGFEGVYGEALQKLIMRTPTDVQDFRDKFALHWEADIRFIRRFLIDTGIKSGFETLRQKKVLHYKDLVPCDFSLPPLECFLDVEVYARARFPNPNRKDNKITCATVWDQRLKTYISILLSDHNDRERLAEDHILIRRETEGLLLSELRNYFTRLNPDVGAEWSVFDFEYLKVRAKRWNIDFSCLNSVCLFDLLQAYAKLYKKSSNRLKDVVFDEGIVDYIEAEVDYADLWENDPMGLVMRNKRHVEWMVKINQKKAGGDLIKSYWNLKNYAGLEDLMETLYHGVLVDTLMLRKYHGKYVLPSKVKHKEGADLTGALVKKPPKGIFSRVAVFDMSRYYQNLMIALNVTPEKTEGLGLAPQVAQDMLDEREKYEKMLAKTVIDSEEYKSLKGVRDSVKYIGEALIGYFGSLKSRLYNPKLFNKVTVPAQKGLLVLESTAQKLGYRVLYYDTDGIYVEMGKGDTGKLAWELNQAMKVWCEKEGMGKTLTLKCDRVFGKVLFKGVKKRLAGHVIWEDGKDCDYLYIQGFEYVRRDSSLITRRVQREVFNIILRGKPSGLGGEQVSSVGIGQDKSKKEGDRISVQNHLCLYLRGILKKMRKGGYSLREISLSKTLHKRFKDYKSKVDFLRGSLYANKYLGADIRAGDKVYMLYVRRIPTKPRTDVVCFLDPERLPENIEVDWNKMISRTIEGKVDELLGLVGLSWERVKGARSLMEVF